MIEFKEISLENKNEIEELIRENKGNDSEFTFTNLFIWRKSYHTVYTVISDIPCFVYRHEGVSCAAAIPVKPNGNKELEEKCVNAASALKKYFSEKKETCNLYIFEEEIAKKISENVPDVSLYKEDRDSFDYVYLVKDLTDLAGKKFHGKKNHVNKFKRLYNWRYMPLNAEMADSCLDVFCRWCKLKGEEKKGCCEEYDSVNELVSNWDKLDVKGGCLFVDETMVAFSIGEQLNPEMAVIHFEYADNEYEGVFPMMNQQFLINCWQDYKYVNREEDMGIEGIRKAKESYRPIFLVPKYIVKL